MPDEPEQTEKLSCFVISPIGEDGTPERKAADTVLKHLIRRALEPAYSVQRGDADNNPGAITPSIISSILSADLVVADLSGANPNAFYELAIAHGYERPVVHVQKAGEKKAFDIKDMRIISYDTSDPDSLEAAVERLKRYAAFARDKPTAVETPLTSAERFISLQTSSDPVAESNREILEQIHALRTDVARIGGGQRQRTLNPADLTAFAKIIGRISQRGGLELSDMTGVISNSTSTAFDQLIERLARRAFPDVFSEDVSSTLYHPEVWADEAHPDSDAPEGSILQ